MHAIFMIYGMRRWADLFLDELSATKLPIPLYDKNPDEHPDAKIVTRAAWETALRVNPLGMYEFVFPKEQQQHVLAGLDFDKVGHTDFPIDKEFNLGIIKIKPLDMLKKYLRIEDVPKIDEKGGRYPFSKWFVSVIPIGVRYEQGYIQMKDGEFKDLWVEAL